MVDANKRIEMVRVYMAWKKAGVDKGYQTLAQVFGVTYYQARNVIAYRGRS